MSTETLSLNGDIRKYLLKYSVNELEVLKELRSETAQMEHAAMQISPEQGAFMAFLVELIQAKSVLEIGVFTGYSSLVVAMALPDDGIVTACDINKEWTSIAEKYWERAQVRHKIDLRIAPALETLDQIIFEGRSGSYDFVFIDADKIGYQAYFNRSLELVRVGGLIAIDNVLWGGDVIDDTIQDSSTQAIREFNAGLRYDERVSITMLPIGDGLTLARKL